MKTYFKVALIAFCLALIPTPVDASIHTFTITGEVVKKLESKCDGWCNYHYERSWGGRVPNHDKLSIFIRDIYGNEHWYETNWWAYWIAGGMNTKAKFTVLPGMYIKWARAF